MRKLSIILIAAASISGSVFAMDNSQGEGSYYGGGYGANSGLKNSQGAATYYRGGGEQRYEGYGVPDHPAGTPGTHCGYENCD
jgi:hypothetical protein